MSSDTLSKENLLAALCRLDELLEQQGITGEICIFGGATMILAFDARESTRDIDAVFVPKTEIYRAADRIADEMDLPASWLNDGVKGFVSPHGDTTTEGMPQWDNLRILRPTSRYLLAMKCMAARIAAYDTVGDQADVLHLCRELGIDTTEDVLKIVDGYYPVAKIPIKTQYFIEEVVAELKGEAK